MVVWLVWVSLAVALVAVIVTGFRAGRSGLALWRQLKSTGAAFNEAVDRVNASAAAVAARAEGVGGGVERVDAAVSHLAVSRARLETLQRAWNEVAAPLGTRQEYLPREKKV